MGVPKDPEKYAAYCKHMSDIKKGIPKSQTTIEKMRNAHLGKQFSEEHRNNIRASKMGTPSPRKGATLSEETKKRLRNSSWMKDPNRKHLRDEMYQKRSQNLEWKKNHDDASKILAQDPTWKQNHKSAMRKRAKNYDIRLKNVESHIGGFWVGNVRYYEVQQYCEKFTPDFKKRCRAYWNYTCMKCGKHESQHITKRGKQRALTVHHVHYDKDMCCNGSPRDVVPLCGSCNVKVNTNRKYWEKYFTDLIYSRNPNGKCYFEPEEMDEE